MSQILIVDDEKDIADSLSEYLSGFGHLVCTASDSDEAFNILKKPDHKFELIISDIKMPKQSGLDFFKKYRETTKEPSKFILMTGHTDLMNVQTAYSIGVDELLAKPFDFDVLKLVVNYLLNLNESIGDNNDKYFAIPIEEMLVSSNSQYNLFLKVAKKFVCVTKTGQEFTTQRIKSFYDKGVRHIFLNSTDFSKYTDLQFAIADSIKQRPLNNAKKAKAFNHLIATVTNNAVINNLDKEHLLRSMQALENYTQIAFHNSRLAEAIISFTEKSPSLAEKSTLLATISSSVADLWKWNSPKIQSRIVLGAMLCDIGLKDFDYLCNKRKLDFTKEEIKDYEDHPLRSFKMLSEIGDLPEEILQIALQHHENGLGSGFPQKLLKNKVHSFSKLVHGVNEFIDTLYAQKNKSDTLSALNQILQMQRKIVNEQVLKSLYIIFKHPLPKEIEGVLLPDKVGRLV